MKIFATDRRKTFKNYYDTSELSGMPCGQHFSYNTSRYQYFVAQLVVISDFDEEVDVTTSPLIGEGQELTKAVRCFNTSGIGPDGVFFYRRLTLYSGKMQPLLIGFDLSEAKLGTFETVVTVGTVKVHLTLTVNDEPIFNDGAEDIFSGSRMKWLNSDSGIGNTPVKGYSPLAFEENNLLFTGKTARIGSNGLLENVQSYFSPSNFLTESVQNHLFYRPMEFEVEGQRYRFSKQRMNGKGSSVAFSAEGRSEGTRLEISAVASYEGYIDYKVTLSAEKDLVIRNVALNLYFSACTYSVGMGRKGGTFAPFEYSWNYNKQQDSVFIGDVNCGARLRLKDKMDILPFEGAFFPLKPYKLPFDTWDNHGKGKVMAIRTPEGVALTASSGCLVLAKGKSIVFCFELHLTPFHQVDLSRRFSKRFCRCKGNERLEDRLERASWMGANALSIDWPDEKYQLINYPFYNAEELKKAVLAARKKKFATTIEYSLWHTSAKNPELGLFKSLHAELIFRHWQEHMECLPELAGPGAVPAVVSKDKEGAVQDVSVLLQTESRMDNYFAEAVDFLIRTMRFDGIRLEGSHIGRKLAERLARICEDNNASCGIILKESDNFLPERCMGNSLNQHTHLLPFVNSISADHSFAKEKSPDYVIAEVSGLLYGLTAEACSPAFHPVESLLYGMSLPVGMCGQKTETVLYGIYDVLQKFGIGNARMYGFWDKTNPASADQQEIRITSFINGEKLLAVIFNSGRKTKEFDIGFNPKLGFSSKGKTIMTPLIVGMQNKKIINFNKSFSLKAGHGLILLVE
jgi:hypothetical protein